MVLRHQYTVHKFIYVYLCRYLYISMSLCSKHSHLNIYVIAMYLQTDLCVIPGMA